MARRLLVLTLVVAGLVGACAASLKLYDIQSINIAHETHVLPNGLKVVVNRDLAEPDVLVQVRYDVGAAADPVGKRGLAHLIEHLAFRLTDEIREEPAADGDGTSATSKDATQAGEAKAIPFQTVRFLVRDNAWTNFDETVYWTKVVPAHVGDVLKNLAEQMGDFSARLDLKVFEAEREVVRNERRERYEGEPLDAWALNLYREIYPAGHPYHGDAVIGSHESIGAITLEDVKQFLTTHYHPSNATLVVSGPVEPAAVLAAVRERFGSHPAKEPTRVTAPRLEPSYRELVVDVPEAKDTMLTVVWPLDGARTEEADAMAMLRNNAGGWFSWKLVTSRGWAHWAWSSVWQHELGSLFIVNALIKDPDDVDDARDAIFELAGLLDDVTEDHEIAQRRRTSIYRTIFDVEAREDRAESLAYFFAKEGKPMGWDAYFKRLKALDGKRVREIGRRVLNRDRAFVMIHRPPAAAARGDTKVHYSAEKVEKAGASRLVNERATTLPKRYEFRQPKAEFVAWADGALRQTEISKDYRLDNGMQVRLIQAGVAPVITVAVLLKSGMSSDPPKATGTTYTLLESLFVEHSSMNDAQSRIGVAADFEVDDEHSALYRRAPSFYAREVLEYMAKLARDPNLVRKDVVENVDAWKHRLGELTKNSSAVADRALWGALRVDHDKRTVSQASLANVGWSAVAERREELLRPDNVVLVVTSDRPAAELEPLVAQYFGDWERDAKAMPRVERINDELASDAALVVAQVPDAKQTAIRVGMSGPGWSDWQAELKARAVSYLLEDNVERLRKAAGVTYGTHVWRYAWQQRGALVVGTEVESGASATAIAMLQRAIERTQAQKLDEGHLDRVQRELITSYVTGSNTSWGRAGTHASRVARGRPLDYDAQVVRYVSSWSLDDLKAEVQRQLALPRVVSIAGVVPSDADLEKAGLGALVAKKVVRDPKTIFD